MCVYIYIGKRENNNSTKRQSEKKKSIFKSDDESGEGGGGVAGGLLPIQRGGGKGKQAYGRGKEGGSRVNVHQRYTFLYYRTSLHPFHIFLLFLSLFLSFSLLSLSVQRVCAAFCLYHRRRRQNPSPRRDYDSDYYDYDYDYYDYC